MWFYRLGRPKANLHAGLAARLLVGVIVASLGLTLAVGSAAAVQPDEILQDAKLEARARDISAQLRCLVCQNQSIDDSNAGLARDLRLLVRERLTKGDSNKQVMDFLVARYGEFVLLKPTFGLHNLVLWLTPLLGLLGGGVLALRYMRGYGGSGDMGQVAELSSGERERLQQLLKE